MRMERMATEQGEGKLEAFYALTTSKYSLASLYIEHHRN